jgi:hypothetical protein
VIPTTRAAVLSVAAALFLAGLAGAVIPDSEKIADAVAETNGAQGRGEALWIDVQLRIGDGPPVATGVLATHPTGLARLELQSTRGFVERHLLQGDSYTASRDGRIIEGNVRPFLPPIFLLQATSGAALFAALESFGVDARISMLGRIDEHDCYVIGGRLPPVPGGEPQHVPSLWVDQQSYEVVQVDREDGVRFRFGPYQAFEKIRVPRWINIEAPDQVPARLEIVRAVPANAPAAAFGIDWLTAPPTQ